MWQILTVHGVTVEIDDEAEARALFLWWSAELGAGERIELVNDKGATVGRAYGGGR